MENEKVFFEDPNVLITQSRIVVTGKTHVMRNISVNYKRRCENIRVNANSTRVNANNHSILHLFIEYLIFKFNSEYYETYYCRWA